ncbi:DNA/RNA nuclease SfsA [Paenibacillus rhizolycopersici]|uniref:DNA/RNA nuclease SfsA n=1 Tax=Paenibacillus rhizolycopersici TaxID=2780073 RepID=UPI003D2DF152
MKYRDIVQGRLQRRVNRFIAEVMVGDAVEQVHVKNTGRLKELLLPDTEVLLEASDRPERKTNYSLIAAAHDGGWVNVDSQAPNPVAFEALNAGSIAEIGPVTRAKREVTYGDSRFDLYYEQGEKRGFIEVKGVTLEQGGIAMFPDAPTARGTKHVLELAKAILEGYAGAVLFVVQMKGCHAFTPYREMDPAFADALKEASRQGVRILAYEAIVTEREIVLGGSLPVRL